MLGGRRPRMAGRVFRALLILAVLAPLLLTLAGALTSPPHVKGPPVGRIIYLEADEPSEHTSLLRGLRVLSPDGTERELLHETEPQDVDAGSRTWINQPCGSPDGKWLAFEQQNITIGEEKQSVVHQLWALPLDGGGKPRLLLDLTKAKLKPFVGLTWTPDSKQVVFLNDANACFVDAQTGKVSKQFLEGKAPALPSTTVSMTHNPTVLLGGKVNFRTNQPGVSAVRADGLFAVADSDTRRDSIQPEGYRSDEDARAIVMGTLDGGGDIGQTAQWGWSVWGGRKITNLRWSPDGKYVAYSVSKRPFEDELFYMDIHTGKCWQMPVRTGSFAWDWVK